MDDFACIYNPTLAKPRTVVVTGSETPTVDPAWKNTARQHALKAAEAITAGQYDLAAEHATRCREACESVPLEDRDRSMKHPLQPRRFPFRRADSPE